MLQTLSIITIHEITLWLLRLQTQLLETHQRKLLCVQGEMEWCDEIVRIARANIIRANKPGHFTISDRQAGFESTAYSKLETLLGRESSLVIVDLFEGINPDALCIASGLLTQGGLLILISDNPQKSSISHDKFGMWQAGATRLGNFTDYWFRELGLYSQACIFLRQNESLPPLTACLPAPVTETVVNKTQEQFDILNRVDAWLNDLTQTIMLVKADRGRGKSTCLGFIVQDLQARSNMKLIVSAYSKLSASVLLKQAGEVEFAAPDQLIKDKILADVLIIDEAAMLPFSMLRQLTARYTKIIMATTTGGYEGTGQGFLLRFLLNFSADKLLLLEIKRPVRWTSQDYLEPCLNSILQLTPRLQSIDTEVLEADISYRVIDVKDCSDVAVLKKVYELMASVHYRTRPSDLRMLMDNSDLSILLAEAGSSLIGILVLNREGGFEADLCEQVFLGNRRPNGHLLAQMLTAQASVKSFAGYRGMRIQRIAVLPAMRRRGIGRQLIERASAYSREQQFDYIGACFAFDAEISQFWHNCQFALVHVGFSHGKSTGNHSVVVLKQLSSQLDNVMGQLHSRLQKQLPVWLLDYLSDLDAENVVALLRISGFHTKQDELDRAEIEAFSRGFKGFELSFPSLQTHVMQAIAQSAAGVEVHDWLVEKAVQNRPWEQLSDGGKIIGRKQMQKKLRELILNLSVKVTQVTKG